MTLFNGRVQGTKVIKPKPGVYNVPVCVLDYASLYPSIMRAYGLCWTTLIVDPAKWRDVPQVVQRIEDPTEAGTTYDVRWAAILAGSMPLLYSILTKLPSSRSRRCTRFTFHVFMVV
jgi:hypothetical protein